MRLLHQLPLLGLAGWLGLNGAWVMPRTVAADEAAVAEPATAEADAGDYPLAVVGPKPKPVTPPTAAELQSAIERGVDFLVASQRKSGAWGGPQRTKELNIYAPGLASHLAFRTGCTGLAVEALCNSRELFDGERREQVEAAIDRGQAWLLEHAPKLTRAEPDSFAAMMGHALYNVWGHSYAIQAALALHDRAAGDEQLQKQLRDLIATQVKRLEGGTYVNGGWGYYDEIARTKVPSGSPNSFTTATALIALKKAEALGLKYPQPLVAKAIASLLRQRYPDFSYAYGEYLQLYPRMGINRPAGSLGRSQACNLALKMYGHEEVTDAIFKTWLDRLFARNGWLSIARKRPVPHDSDFSVAGYFYYYGHYYAAMCIEELPAAERPYFQDHLAKILLPLQEKDGSWWDYPLYDYHQSWGTAMAVSALVRCRHEAE
jgi:hypothetical protein